MLKRLRNLFHKKAENKEKKPKQKVVATVGGISQQPPQLPAITGMPKKPKVRGEKIFGVIIIIIFFVVFVLWSAFAPLETAAIAPGSITIEGKHKIIQHLEGGIVTEIDVKENSLVKQGQVLIKLQDTQAKASLQVAENEYYQALAIAARVTAELEDQTQINFQPLLLAQKSNAVVAQALQTQASIFKSNQKAFRDQVKIYEQRVSQLKQQITGLQSEFKANTQQLKLMNKELKDISILAQKHLVKQSQLLALQREEASLEGKHGEIEANIARNKDKIAETDLEIINLKNEYHQKLLTELHQVEAQLADAREKVTAAADVLARTTIRAPVSGRVIGLTVHTIGRVIKPGETIMSIVPSNAKYVIEAKVSPLDIDVVHEGLPAKIRLTPLKQRTTPLLKGEVVFVSADVFQDQNNNRNYYLAQVSLDEKQLSKLNQTAIIYPGMPVEVLIITGKVTPLRYFLSPIFQTFNRAFRED